VLGFIEGAKKAGEEPIIGGHQKGTKGLFVEPTIFLNPNSNSSIYKDEIFGPVLTIKTFKTEEEVIELANDTNTGLSGISLLLEIIVHLDANFPSIALHIRYHSRSSCCRFD